MTTGQLLFLEDLHVKQVGPIGKLILDYNGQWYVVAYAVGEGGKVSLYYLQTDGSWGESCIDNGIPTGYFATAVETEETLQKAGPILFHERAVHEVDLDFMTAWKILNP
ncbi:MAG TPA: hypothetical protein VMR46_01125 [Candidatus Paceibacterota bacterium]|nr:hypothetical protein [Candidatus Paceibacterota bacterium]